MSMLLLDVFDCSRTRDTRGSQADTHYHIVTTFEAKAGAKSWRFRAVGASSLSNSVLSILL
jgi:hypothetical protein